MLRGWACLEGRSQAALRARVVERDVIVLQNSFVEFTL